MMAAESIHVFRRAMPLELIMTTVRPLAVNSIVIYPKNVFELLVDLMFDLESPNVIHVQQMPNDSRRTSLSQLIN